MERIPTELTDVSTVEIQPIISEVSHDDKAIKYINDYYEKLVKNVTK